MSFVLFFITVHKKELIKIDFIDFFLYRSERAFLHYSFDKLIFFMYMNEVFDRNDFLISG